jgi:hypothetical protein
VDIQRFLGTPTTRPVGAEQSQPHVQTGSGTYRTVSARTAPAANSPKAPATKIEIIGAEELDPATLQRLQDEATLAVSTFEREFAQPPRPLKIDVSKGQAALHTGYNYEKDTVFFPSMTSVINQGLDSPDVVNHEIFHALVCQTYPDTQSQIDDPKVVRIHEALADFFAHQLHPDKEFGENYYLDSEPGKGFRQYENSLSVKLAAGAHAQGNAITSHLLRNGIALEQVKGFLERGDFTVEGLATMSPQLKADLETDSSFSIAEQIGNYPPSTIGKYRISQDRPLEIGLEPNDAVKAAYPNFEIRWMDMKATPSKYFHIHQPDPGLFKIEALPNAQNEKMLAVYYDGPNMIGSKPYYFGPELGGAKP